MDKFQKVLLSLSEPEQVLFSEGIDSLLKNKVEMSSIQVGSLKLTFSASGLTGEECDSNEKVNLDVDGDDVKISACHDEKKNFGKSKEDLEARIKDLEGKLKDPNFDAGNDDSHIKFQLDKAKKELEALCGKKTAHSDTPNPETTNPSATPGALPSTEHPGDANIPETTVETKTGDDSKHDENVADDAEKKKKAAFSAEVVVGDEVKFMIRTEAFVGKVASLSGGNATIDVDVAQYGFSSVTVPADNLGKSVAMSDDDDDDEEKKAQKEADKKAEDEAKAKEEAEKKAAEEAAKGGDPEKKVFSETPETPEVPKTPAQGLMSGLMPKKVEVPEPTHNPEAFPKNEKREFSQSPAKQNAGNMMSRLIGTPKSN